MYLTKWIIRKDMKDKIDAIDRKKCTAYHEAGHVLAAILLREEFEFVTIKEDSDSFGKVVSRSGNHYEYEYNSIMDPCQFSKYFLSDFRKIAGLVAEKMYLGKKNFSGAKADLTAIIDTTIADLPESFNKKYLSFLSEYVFNVFCIVSNRIRLEAVADELLIRETLSYSDVLEIMRRSLLRKIQDHA